jgi:transposase
MDPPAESPTRFVALDVARSSSMIAAVDARQQVVLKPRRVGVDQIEPWSRAHLTRADAVVLEATAHAWHLYDQLRPLVGSVTVCHPLLVKLIAGARVKTDRRDALNLAKLLAAGLIPAVWVPPPDVRELRALVSHRQRLVRQRSQVRNRLHGVLHRHNLFPPAGKPFGAGQRTWWACLDLVPSEQLRVRQDRALLDGLEPLIREVDDELAQLSTREPWAGQVAFLVQLPGLGLHTAMVVLAAIGDITRFPAASKLVGYAGLGASISASGQMQRTGGITQQGRRALRAALVEAAWVAVQTHPYWKQTFGRLERRMGRNKAIVASARKLLVVIWHVLSARVADRQADPAKVALKMLTWAWKLGAEQRAGLTPGQFVRRELTRLRLGDMLTVVQQSGRNLRIPPATPAEPDRHDHIA